MRVEELLKRARSQIGRKTIYRLGSGGMCPGADRPTGDDGACDCSGFVCWALRLCRNTNHPFYMKQTGGWINTNAMAADIKATAGFFEKLSKAKPGCIVVYPGGIPGHKIGHVGIVASVSGGRPGTVIHCSSGNFRTHGDAIRETGPEVFDTPHSLFGWYSGLEG